MKITTSSIICFNSASRARSVASEAKGRIRLIKQTGIVYDTPAALLVEVNDDLIAIHTSADTVQMFAGANENTVRSFITAASDLR